MASGMSLFFTKMIGTLSVILVVAFLIGGRDNLYLFHDETPKWRRILMAGVLGGAFGIYGNLSGISFQGAVISVRDIGPMLAGLLGGPAAGLLGGAIAGLHRLSMGGITAKACVVATCTIGTLCGLLTVRHKDLLRSPWLALALGGGMECIHLGIVLLMVRPFETAWSIVSQIALPFILVNALGLALMAAMMVYIRRQQALSVDRSRLQSELETAKVIQRSLLPPINDRYPGRPELDLAVAMEPAKAVGGDFYDCFFLDKDRIAFVVADVSGKGIPASLIMVKAKQTIQNCVRDIPGLAKALAVANNALCADNEAEMFVTAWVGVLAIPTGEMTFVSAGHNPPVLLSHGRASLLRTRGSFVLGGMEDVAFRESQLTLCPGDLLFLYTDGVTEAENAEHALYGEDRLLACIAAHPVGTAAETVARVRADMDSHVQGFDQFDDITILCLKVQ